MTSIIIIFILIISILLTIVVLVQNSKGGGLASNLGVSSNQFGVKKTNDFLEKLTWGLAIGLITLCLGINVFIKDAVIEEADTPASINVEKAMETKSLPNMPAAKAPATAQKPSDQKPE